MSRRQSIAHYVRAHVPLVFVMIVIGVAVVLVFSDRWRRGAIIFGVATLLAAAFRLFLPKDQVGLLAVRGKWFDAAALFTIGTAIVVLAASIDPLGTG